jgi:hypothetical protein
MWSCNFKYVCKQTLFLSLDILLPRLEPKLAFQNLEKPNKREQSIQTVSKQSARFSWYYQLILNIS